MNILKRFASLSRVKKIGLFVLGAVASAFIGQWALGFPGYVGGLWDTWQSKRIEMLVNQYKEDFGKLYRQAYFAREAHVQNGKSLLDLEADWRDNHQVWSEEEKQQNRMARTAIVKERFKTLKELTEACDQYEGLGNEGTRLTGNLVKKLGFEEFERQRGDFPLFGSFYNIDCDEKYFRMPEDIDVDFVPPA